MSRFVLVLAILCTACGDDDPEVAADAAAVDAAGRDAGVAEQCVDLRAKWNALVEPLAQSCDAPSDCVVVGERCVRSCEGYPQLPGNGAGELPGDCNGAAVNAAALAPKLSEVRALETSFAQSCGNDRSLCGVQGITCVADCAPGATLTCFDHRCGRTHGNGCLLPPRGAAQ